MRKRLVRIEDVLRIQKERNAINRLKFINIVWTQNNKEIYIDPKTKDDWELYGLSNCDFITSNYYKGLAEMPF